MDLGKWTFIISLILQIVIRYPYRKGTQQKVTDRQEQLVLGLITIGSGLLPLLYILNWLPFANYDAPLWVIILGIIVMIAGLYLFWRAHTDLGENWSSTLEIHDSHKLVTNGIYNYIRHPMYAANWLMMIAQALLLSNWIAGFGGLIGFSFMYFLRVPKEEAMMFNEFGEQYQDYMSKTGRILPKLG